MFEDREPHNEPHLSLLVRDYARGIIEFAFMKSKLPSDVMLERSRAPYCSSPAQLNVSDESLNQTANKAGDETIGAMGDFASYEIKPRVGAFTTVDLNLPRPVSNQEMFERFKAEVVDIDKRRIVAVRNLQEKHALGFQFRFEITDEGKASVNSAKTAEWMSQVKGS